ncbi:unnamed protein product [Microthlaspi erraticum]|uniref:1-phosphatidylinositol 4-kinase n=1 Tax=Microthlaspi erraticum TaxID=1685480 RepID=A0A6D2KM41_9BRAS|nr:unnamed protein product [Microthlaspi erraticum]
MEFGFEETFPQLDLVPEPIGESLREMILYYIQAKPKKGKLPKLSGYNVCKVVDEKGEICCLFKTYTHEKYTKLEPAVYLLDHPPQGHRSVFASCLGLSGVPPTIFFRSKEESGCLVKYVGHDSVAGEVNDGLQTLPEEIQKLCVTHIRFGCTDAHDGNTLVKRDEKGIDRLIPVDHEESFNNGFKLGTLWWTEVAASKEAFSSKLVKYVRDLDVERDVAFLKKAGWEVSSSFTKHFDIFTHFLKKSVELLLSPYEIGILALGAFKRFPNYNLHEIVNTADRSHGDSIFIKSAKEKIDQSLTEYVLKVHNRRVGKKPSK